MARTVNSFVQGLPPSGIRKMYNRLQQVPGAINLTIGQPDFLTPEHVKEAGIEAIRQNHTAYTANVGLLELRQEIASYFADKYNVHYRAEDEIIVTAGAGEALDVVFRTLLEPGDEVILPAPLYTAYEPLVRLQQGVPVFIDTRPTGFKVTVEAIQASVTPKTKAILLNYPSNPTGVTYTPGDIKELATYLATEDFFVIADEIYSENVFGQPHVSIASFEQLHDRTIVVHGLSKSHAMTGWRIGFLLAPAAVSEQLHKVHLFNVGCASSISQHAAIEALRHGRHDAGDMNLHYIKRREYIYNRLVNMGLEVVKPTGAFYIFPKIPDHFESSESFAYQLLEEEKVGVVPGNAFSDYGEGYIRISYAYSMDIIEEGMNRIEAFLRKHAK